MSDDAADNKPEFQEETTEKRGKSGRWGAAGVGAAIGSAAIVAALLYANRAKVKDKLTQKGKVNETD
ncbi:hypothetical protein [Sphingomonas sp. C3-2]|uniref:hypothetical protein n=1 Tax=Sphingomonas sp. C3-2 TaxID=3062169 RepID=UPI00294AFDBB|nr:hypothetical protein [Sphingomonas sp. C3-2]WOK38116.1 hypothetical protein QYC26_08040 [Sphingomonas sp. C3-2]